MKHSESISKIGAALAKAQGSVRDAAKDAINPHFNRSYADLASVWDACREPLHANELAVLQSPRAAGKMVTVETMLIHSSGEWFCDELTMAALNELPQSVGSAITYARRYALMAMVGIAPADDDGNEATKGKSPLPARKTETPRKPPAREQTVTIVSADPAGAPPHDPVTGEVIESVADKLRARIVTAQTEDTLKGIGGEVAEAYKVKAITDDEKTTLSASYKARMAEVKAAGAKP